MMISDEPPVSQFKIEVEGNESKEQFNLVTNQNF